MPYSDKAKQKDYRQKYYLRNKERLSAAARERYLRNPSIVIARSKVRYEEKKDEIRAQNKIRYEENKEEVLNRCKAWVMANPEKSKEIKKRYRDTHKVKIASYNRVHNKKTRTQRYSYRSQWRRNNPEKEKAGKLRNRFGLSLQQFKDMLEDQGNKCGVCGIDLSNGGMNHPCVDHDHKTGMVRGILCRRCNSGIGSLKDEPKLLNRAVKWIRKGGLTPDNIPSSPILTKRGRKRTFIKRLYGLRQDQFYGMLSIQDKKCGICKVKFTEHVPLNPIVDHIHDSDPLLIRGLLCGKCNRAIGLLKDNTEIMNNAVKWIRRARDSFSRKKYYQANRVKEKEYQKRVYWSDVEKGRNKTSEYIANNVSKRRRSRSRCYQKNKDRIQEYNHRYYMRNRDRILQRKDSKDENR